MSGNIEEGDGWLKSHLVERGSADEISNRVESQEHWHGHLSAQSFRGLPTEQAEPLFEWMTAHFGDVQAITEIDRYEDGFLVTRCEWYEGLETPEFWPRSDLQWIQPDIPQKTNVVIKRGKK